MAICKDKKEILASPPCIGASHLGTFTLLDRRLSDFTLRLHALLKRTTGDLLKGPLLILFLSCALIAETAAPIGQSAPQAAAPVSRGANPNAIPTFDEGFFNKVGPGSEKPGSFDGSDSKVTSDVRARLLSECESKKASGMAAYGKCYREKENAVVNSREKEIDRINTQNNLPLRNTPKLIEEVQSKSVEDND